MSEKELEIINFIMERFGVTEQQATAVISDVQKQVPDNRRNEVIDFIYSGLQSNIVTSVDGITELAQVKVAEIKEVQARTARAEAKRQAKETAFEAAIEARTNSIKSSERTELNQKQEAEKQMLEDFPPRDGELPELAKDLFEFIQSTLPADSKSLLDKLRQESTEGFTKEEQEKAKKEIEEKVEENMSAEAGIVALYRNREQDERYRGNEELYVQSLKIARKICAEKNISPRSAEAEAVFYEILGRAFSAKAQEEVAKNLGVEEVLTPEQEEKAREIEDPEQRKMALHHLRTIEQNLQDYRRQLETETDPEKIKELSIKIERFEFIRYEWGFNQELFKIRELAAHHEISTQLADALSSAYRSVMSDSRNQMVVATRCIEDDISIEDKKILILKRIGMTEEDLELLEDEDSKAGVFKSTEEVERIQFAQMLKKNPTAVIGYYDAYFDERIASWEDRLKKHEEKLKDATGPKRDELLEKIETDKSFLELYSKRELTTGNLREFMKSYSTNFVQDTLQNAGMALSMLEVEMKTNDSKQVTELWDKMYSTFVETVDNSGVSKSQMERGILENKNLEAKTRIELITAINNRSVDPNDTVALERNDDVRTVANAFIDAADKQCMQGKTVEELKALFNYFDEFYSTNNNVYRFTSNLTADNIDQVMEEMQIKEEYRDFFKDVFTPIVQDAHKLKAVHHYMSPTKTVFPAILKEYESKYDELVKEENKRNGIVAKAYCDSAKELTGRLSPEEASQVLDYFHDFYSNFDQMQEFSSGLNYDTLEAKLEGLDAPEECKKFISSVLTKSFERLRVPSMDFYITDFNTPLKKVEESFREKHKQRMEKAAKKQEEKGTNAEGASSPKKTEKSESEPVITETPKEVADTAIAATPKVEEVVQTEPQVGKETKVDMKASLVSVTTAKREGELTETTKAISDGVKALPSKEAQQEDKPKPSTTDKKNEEKQVPTSEEDEQSLE